MRVQVHRHKCRWGVGAGIGTGVGTGASAGVGAGAGWLFLGLFSKNMLLATYFWKIIREITS